KAPQPAALYMPMADPADYAGFEQELAGLQRTRGLRIFETPPGAIPQRVTITETRSTPGAEPTFTVTRADATPADLAAPDLAAGYVGITEEGHDGWLIGHAWSTRRGEAAGMPNPALEDATPAAPPGTSISTAADLAGLASSNAAAPRRIAVIAPAT